MVQNLTYSGAYLRITLAFALLQKVMELVLLTETIPVVFVATMTIVLPNSYASLEVTLNNLKLLKLKVRLEENILEFYVTILVYYEHLDSVCVFYPKPLGYITHIF